MKSIDLRIGEKVEIECGDELIEVIPQHKSGNRIRIGIHANQEVFISNAMPLKEDGLVDIAQS